MIELLSFGGLVVLTIGIVEVGKRIGLPKRTLPLVSLVVGFCLAMIANVSNITELSILTGVAVGLAGCGLFDIAKVSLLGK